MKRSFLFDTAATDNTGGDQNAPSEQPAQAAEQTNDTSANEPSDEDEDAPDEDE